MQQPIAETLRQAMSLHQQGRLPEAKKLYAKILKIDPDHFDALHLLGVLKHQQGDAPEALRLIAAALKTDATPDALSNYGNVLCALNRHEEALASYDRALALQPENVLAITNRGAALTALGRPMEALACYDRALAINPAHADAHYNRGNALSQIKHYDKALHSYNTALAIAPHFIKALFNRGNVFKELKRYDEAIASYDAALALAPDFSDALYNRFSALKTAKRYDDALAAYDKAIAVNPENADPFGLADATLAICDWTRAGKLAGDLVAQVRQGKLPVSPFTLLNSIDDAALHRRCAEAYVKSKVPVRPQALWKGEKIRHDKIRLAYLSADFHSHATAYLMAELFERHDHGRFEVLGISFGMDDRSDLRRRLIASFEQFHDVQGKTDREVAELLREHQVDIAVDLKGYTQDARPEILAHRPAPIQVNYLGYPGTMGADFIDYVIADKIVLPFDQQAFYSEKIVHLPDSYQVNDSKRKIAERVPTRREAGLPENGFVFCCFNNNYKIAPQVFDTWMRLLQQVPGSVLWLLADNASAENNLRKEAQARGVNPARLIFAARLKLDEHLARHRLADLFLDTLPYNAHTTASDALWVGLPVLTCQGRTFAARVAASLLCAVGLEELVTHNLADYEALALRLATEPSLLHDIRRKLAQNKQTHPLFDTGRFCRHIEAAYQEMWETWQRGEAPRSFAVNAEARRQS
jgi:predicted O-linked N-acetylglucosamine transferase (SPINDLY family)